MKIDRDRVALDGLFYCLPWMNAANAIIAQHEEALAWVIDNFNTFAQPPEHLKSIVDEACLKAMTADEDAVRMTENTSGAGE